MTLHCSRRVVRVDGVDVVVAVGVRFAAKAKGRENNKEQMFFGISFSSKIMRLASGGDTGGVHRDAINRTNDRHMTSVASHVVARYAVANVCLRTRDTLIY